ncbi:MAG TPA: alpha/beta hydrolase [Thermomonospora sp.]|nr:alpha/beta hydrolase [Thermomonospora sp.]
MSTATEAAATDTVAVRPPRWRRRVRRLLIALVALLTVTTGASLVFNAVTAERAEPPPGLTYVQAADVKTRYRTWGTRGRPVVLVHGAFESADTWARLAPLLARDHRVYALDLTGSGYSARRGPYTTGHLASQLLGFLDAMGLTGAGQRPVLVGHSSGAAVVAEATLRAPGRIGGLLLLDGDALDTGAGSRTPVTRLFIDPYRTTLLRLALGSDWLIRTIYESQCGPACPSLDRAGVDVWRRPYQVAGAERGVWESVAAGGPGLPADRVALLRGTGVPASVVFGADDDVFSADTPAETAARVGAPPPTLVPGARHLPMISHPDTVAAAVRALVARAGR